MADLLIVRRYARALFEVARKLDHVEAVAADLEGLDAIMAASPRLGRVLRAPTIPAARKRELVDNIFAGRVNELTLRFLRLLVEKKREDVLRDLPAEYRRLSYEMLGIQPVEITSAVELTEMERQGFRESLARRTGKRIELREHVDADLIGGAVVRVGDTILDGSIRSQLRRLRERLLAGAGAAVE
jgi:F-type H+-transporting ATPase subunit delta